MVVIMKVMVNMIVVGGEYDSGGDYDSNGEYDSGSDDGGNNGDDD